MAVTPNTINFSDLPKKIKRRLKPEFRKRESIKAQPKVKLFDAREAWEDVKKRIEADEPLS